MQFIQSYYTDIGIKRKSNQDSLGLLKAETDYGEVLFAIICDGMGGHQSGELASKICIKKFAKWFKVKFPSILYSGKDFNMIKRDWKQLISECNSLLVDYGKKNGIEMGSTLTAFLFIEDKYLAVHVGDSRGYLVNESVQQITRDHSFLAQEVAKGNITQEEAKKDKRGNLLLECVGITKSINMDFYTGEVIPRSSFLLCTDGFWHRIEDEELLRYLSGNQMKDNKMMRMHLNYLVETVKNRDEKDNISVIGITPFS